MMNSIMEWKMELHRLLTGVGHLLEILMGIVNFHERFVN